METQETSENILFSQMIPLILTVAIFLILSFFIYLEVVFLNKFTASDIAAKIRWSDVAVGLTIYLKTAVDFAIFIGNLMNTFRGWKNRVAIEIGTALGNAVGTIIILFIWDIFRNVDILLAVMVFIASLVLLKLAQDGLEHAKEPNQELPQTFLQIVINLDKGLSFINKISGNLLRFLIPNITMNLKKKRTLSGLFMVSLTIPFILGLDDFAGYVPVFNLVNVFGFAIGVLLGHMILNFSLFLSPKRTTALVKNPIVSLLGSLIFVGLAFWGFYEVTKITTGFIN